MITNCDALGWGLLALPCWALVAFVVYRIVRFYENKDGF